MFHSYLGAVMSKILCSTVSENFYDISEMNFIWKFSTVRCTTRDSQLISVRVCMVDAVMKYFVSFIAILFKLEKLHLIAAAKLFCISQHLSFSAKAVEIRSVESNYCLIITCS